MKTTVELAPPSILPRNEHTIDPARPHYVTGAKHYRLSWTAIITADHPEFPSLAGTFPPDIIPAAGSFGLAGVESQEHSACWIGPSRLILGYRATGDPDPIPWAEFMSWPECVGQGVYAAFWPNTRVWWDLIPATTWNPNGRGLLAEYPHPAGGSVVVYETLTRARSHPNAHQPKPGRDVPVATWHCTVCHKADSDRAYSADPDTRRSVCRAARLHLDSCEGPAAAERLNRATSLIAAELDGPGAQAASYASHCNTRGQGSPERPDSSCAEIREARTWTSRHLETTR